jgi:FHS family glucose/mannose:H+ symporter-like MFS transporter
MEGLDVSGGDVSDGTVLNEVSSDATGDVPGGRADAKRRTHRRWLLTLFLAMIFLYVGVESSVSSFFPSIFIPYFHEAPAVASLSVATFWTAMVLGRGATGWVVQRVSYGRFLFWSIAGTVALFASLAITAVASLAYVEVFLLGLCMSGIFSITLVFANHAIPGAARLVTSLVTVFAGLGGAIIPPLTGFTLDHATPASAIWVIAGVATLLFVGLLSVQRRVLLRA